MEDTDNVECVIGGQVLASLPRAALQKYFHKITTEEKQCHLDEWFVAELQVTPEDFISYIKAIMQEAMNQVLKLSWPKIDVLWYAVESMGVDPTIHNCNQILVCNYTDYLSKNAFATVDEMSVALEQARSKLSCAILTDILKPIAKAKSEFYDHLDRHMHLFNPSIHRPLKQVQDAFVKHWSWISVPDEDSKKYEMDFNINFKARSLAAMIKMLPPVWLLNHVGKDLQQIGKNIKSGEYRIGYRLKRILNAIWDRVHKHLGRFQVTDNISGSVEVEMILLQIESLDKEDNLAENWQTILNAINSVRWILPFDNLQELFLGLTNCPPGLKFYGEKIISMMEPFWRQKNNIDNVKNDWTIGEQWCALIDKVYGDDSQKMVEKLVSLWDSLTPANKFYFGLSVAEYYVFVVKSEKYIPPQSVVDRLNKHCFKQNWFVASVNT